MKFTAVRNAVKFTSHPSLKFDDVTAILYLHENYLIVCNQSDSVTFYLTQLFWNRVRCRYLYVRQPYAHYHVSSGVRMQLQTKQKLEHPIVAKCRLFHILVSMHGTDSRLNIEAYHNLNRVLRKAATRSYLSGEVHGDCYPRV